MDEYVGERAVVLGAGIAGLLTARVLSDRYRSVLIVDRDKITGVTTPRRGVPQGRHAHGLLARGQELLEGFFPGLCAELVAAGTPTCDLSGGLRWYFNGKVLQQRDSGLLNISATRPVLEAHVRNRVLALPNVSLREGTVIQGLVASPDRSRVIGVRLAGPGDDAEQTVTAADLVVDATGRGSRTPAWLEELGYPRPAEEKIKIDLAYTSRYFRYSGPAFGDDLAINSVASPANPRGAFFGKYAGDLVLLSLTGMFGDRAPQDHEGFLEFARTLAAQEIYPAARAAEPISEISTFRVPASVRRLYHQLTRFPNGYLVVGDSVCAFNPVYGQGMTVAAMEAAALAAHLGTGQVDPLGFYAEIAPIIDVPWGISAGGDLAFPQVDGPRPFPVRMGNAYVARLHAAAHHDGRFTSAFFRVAGLVDPPAALMRPRLALGVLGSTLRTALWPRTGPAPEAGPATPAPRDERTDLAA